MTECYFFVNFTQREIRHIGFDAYLYVSELLLESIKRTNWCIEDQIAMMSSIQHATDLCSLVNDKNFKTDRLDWFQ